VKRASQAQAALLALVAEHEERGVAIEWTTATDDDTYRPSRARLYVEVIDREANTSRFDMADGHTYAHRVATVEACVKAGWLSILHERTINWPASEWNRRSRTWLMRQIDLTEDGVIAAGVWRERRLNADPEPLPTMTDREREIAELAQRAYDLGYALCARTDVRKEATRMRRAGWFRGCWIANSAHGLVPTPMAVVELRPERADRA
jgi:hypothetical protein